MVLLLLITRWGSAELCAGHVTVLTQLVSCYILYHSLVDIQLRQYFCQAFFLFLKVLKMLCNLMLEFKGASKCLLRRRPAQSA